MVLRGIKRETFKIVNEYLQKHYNTIETIEINVRQKDRTKNKRLAIVDGIYEKCKTGNCETKQAVLSAFHFYRK